jgi:hypothetical protein
MAPRRWRWKKKYLVLLRSFARLGVGLAMFQLVQEDSLSELVVH